jgi:NADH-quinone oxidoreductase subunit I
MTAIDFVKKVFFIEILQGLALTLKHFFTPSVTRQYPTEKRDPFPGSRGLHALVRNPDGKEKCVGCGLCAAMCPSECIYIYTSEGDDHKKIVDRYEIEVLRCVYCALCVEACPYGAVVLMENWDKFMANSKGLDYLDRFWRPKSGDFGPPPSSKTQEGKAG